MIEILIIAAVIAIVGSIVKNSIGRVRSGKTSAPVAAETPDADRSAALAASLRARLAPPAGAAWKSGLAAIVLVDVSGSMHDRIRGEKRRKIEAAQASAIDLIGTFARYAAAHPETPVQVGVYEFS